MMIPSILVVLLSICQFSNIVKSFNIRFPFSRSTISSNKLFINRQQTVRFHLTKAPEVNTEEDDKILRQTALMISLWEKISFPPNTETEGDQGAEYKLSDFGLNRADVRGFLNHFQNCKDCAADNAFLIATQNSENEDVLKLTSINFPLLSEDEDDEEWSDFDNYFDDENKEEGEERSSGDGETSTKSATAASIESHTEVEGDVFPVEHDDEIVLQDTKDWVRKMIADLGICPFTVSPMKAGIPLGGVRYTLSRAHGIDEAFLRFWQEVAALLITTEKEISTVLLVFPEIELFGNFELFEGYCDTLNDALCSSCMNMESKLQLVFFHPRYQFRDGKARLTSDEQAGAANFARRSPWPMINILRTNQVRAAQKGIPTGQVYYQNEEKLCKVGTSALQHMLTTRNWDDLPSYSTPGKLLLAAQKTAAGSGTDALVDQEESIAAAMAVGVCPYIPPPFSSSSANNNASDDSVVNNEEYDSGWPATTSQDSSNSYYDDETQQYISILESDNTYVTGVDLEQQSTTIKNSEEYDAGWPDLRHSQSSQQALLDDLAVHMQGIDEDLDTISSNTEEYDSGWPAVTDNSVLEPESVHNSDGSYYDEETQQQYTSVLESDNNYVTGTNQDEYSSEEYDAGWPTQSHSQQQHQQQSQYNSDNEDEDEDNISARQEYYAGFSADDDTTADNSASEEYDAGWPAEGQQPLQSYDADSVSAAEEQVYSSILEADTYNNSNSDRSDDNSNSNNSEEYDAGWPDQNHQSSSSSTGQDDDSDSSSDDSGDNNEESFDESLF